MDRSAKHDFSVLRSGHSILGFSPYPDYDRLRAHAPIWQAPWGDWLLSSYDAVTEAFHNPDCLSHRVIEADDVSKKITHFFAEWLLFLDAPKHTELRRELAGLFGSAPIANLREPIRKLAEELVPDSDSGQIDFIRSFAKPLPVAVISELLGIPLSDRHLIAGWAEVLRDAFDDLPKGQACLATAALEMRSYFLDLASDPKWLDLHGDKKLRGLLATYPREAVAAQLAFFVFAGHDTTVHLIGSLLFMMASRPELWMQLRAEPAWRDAATEETLRYESPIQKICRVTAKQVTIAGVEIPERQNLVLLLGAANRDEKVFPRPQEFLFRKPNKQIAFGKGSHLCLGRSLALLEARVALDVLLARWEQLSVEDGCWEWHPNASFRGLRKLDLSWRNSSPNITSSIIQAGFGA